MGRPDLGATAGVFEGGAVIEARVRHIDADDGVATLDFDGGTLTVGHFGVQPGEAVRVRIRAREVSIALEVPQRISIQNILRGTVVALEALHGASVNVTIVVGAATLRARITKRAARQLALAPGMAVYALIKAVSLDRHGILV
jgi:molybdate transport system ATP-binding protein